MLNAWIGIFLSSSYYLIMQKIILLFSISVFGWIGWWFGARLGIMTAYLVSMAGSLLGVVVGVLFNRKYLE